MVQQQLSAGYQVRIGARRSRYASCVPFLFRQKRETTGGAD